MNKKQRDRTVLKRYMRMKGYSEEFVEQCFERQDKQIQKKKSRLFSSFGESTPSDRAAMIVASYLPLMTIFAFHIIIATSQEQKNIISYIKVFFISFCSHVTSIFLWLAYAVAIWLAYFSYKKRRSYYRTLNERQYKIRIKQQRKYVYIFIIGILCIPLIIVALNFICEHIIVVLITLFIICGLFNLHEKDKRKRR